MKKNTFQNKSMRKNEPSKSEQPSGE